MTRYEHLRNKPPVTKKQEALYRAWRSYLRDSKLSEPEQHRRASHFADIGYRIPKEAEG